MGGVCGVFVSGSFHISFYRLLFLLYVIQNFGKIEVENHIPYKWIYMQREDVVTADRKKQRERRFCRDGYGAEVHPDGHDEGEEVCES